MSKGEAHAFWVKIDIEGSTPGGRYGHSLSYTKPYIVLFGGYYMNEPVNDTWVLSIERMPFVWQRLELKENTPTPRVYHTATVCTCGKALGMIVLFGGRGKDQTALGDTWGLRKHRDGLWEWVVAPLNGNAAPKARFQVWLV
eukprot:TRINITY_DN8344_c0_g5_i1.p2 TRINITY_DN8344_c0_g5~~TRINITY_DN8344_c0_g5_i1.p2  ORF type:complete len:142 (-),score=32.22 TRINITY_DN8344_c0_g5_i1:31-456(-)